MAKMIVTYTIKDDCEKRTLIRSFLTEGLQAKFVDESCYLISGSDDPQKIFKKIKKYLDEEGHRLKKNDIVHVIQASSLKNTYAGTSEVLLKELKKGSRLGDLL